MGTLMPILGRNHAGSTEPRSGKSVDSSRRRGWRRGLELIEAAIVTPLLILILYGLIEYGVMFLQEQTITNIARQTARVAAVPDGNYTGTFSSLKTNAGGEYSNLAATYSNVGGAAGSLLTVTVSMPYSSITGGALLPVPSTLTASVSMENEGP